MAFSVTTRAVLVAAVAALATLSPANGVDFTTGGTADAAALVAKAAATPAAASAASAAGAAAAATPSTSPAAGAAAAASAASAASGASAAAASASSGAAAATGSVPTKLKKTVDGWPGAIVIKGNKFFDSKTGLEFRMKGMAYYPRPNAGELSKVANYDWAADEHENVWGPDLAIMQDLGVNTIRLYSVDPSKSHDKFMCAAASAGMYVLIGMAAPCKDCAILDELPPKCYPDALFERMQMVYNAFAVYDNVLGFSVGNENNLLRTYEKTGIQTMPCAKALLRDTRSYAASCAGSLRQVPIGLDLADILPRDQWLTYMDCAVDKNEYTRAEWLGFNPYVECDPVKNTQYSQSAGLKNLMSVYSKIEYPRPLMFGEFGCNLGKNTIGEYENQRSFYDAKWMNEEPEMEAEIVGGNVFEFVTEIPNTVAKSKSSLLQGKHLEWVAHWILFVYYRAHQGRGRRPLRCRLLHAAHVRPRQGAVPVCAVPRVRQPQEGVHDDQGADAQDERLQGRPREGARVPVQHFVHASAHADVGQAARVSRRPGLDAQVQRRVLERRHQGQERPGAGCCRGAVQHQLPRCWRCVGRQRYERGGCTGRCAVHGCRCGRGRVLARRDARARVRYLRSYMTESCALMANLLVYENDEG
jgi:hypothetical protein